jgi:AcrR family transcriptional regulator
MSTKTRDRILATALQLFNERGARAVTVRHIAAEMGISHGNLGYYFANSDALVNALYDELIERVEVDVRAALAEPRPALEYMLRLARTTFELLYAYRFLLLDFVALMRRVPGLRERYRELQRLRGAQLRQLLDGLIAVGLVGPEPLPGQFDVLKEQATILGDFWISSSEILYEGDPEHRLAFYLRLFMGLLVPYLTEKGRIEYQRLDFSP